MVGLDQVTQVPIDLLRNGRLFREDPLWIVPPRIHEVSGIFFHASKNSPRYPFECACLSCRRCFLIYVYIYTYIYIYIYVFTPLKTNISPCKIWIWKMFFFFLMVPFQDEFVHFFGGGVKKELSPLHILCFPASWSKEKHTKRWFIY